MDIKKKKYVRPEMHIYEIGTMQLLAGSGNERLIIGGSDDDDVPTSSDGTYWGD